jgi:hypothetical protein
MLLQQAYQRYDGGVAAEPDTTRRPGLACAFRDEPA